MGRLCPGTAGSPAAWHSTACPHVLCHAPGAAAGGCQGAGAGSSRGQLPPAPCTQQPLCRGGAGYAWPRGAWQPWVGGSARQRRGWGDGAVPRHSEGHRDVPQGRGPAQRPQAPRCHALPPVAPCRRPAPAREGRLVKELWGLAGPGELGTPPGATAPALLPTPATMLGGLPAVPAQPGTPIPDRALHRGCGGCGAQAGHPPGTPNPAVGAGGRGGGAIFAAASDRMGLSRCVVRPDVLLQPGSAAGGRLHPRVM